MFIIFILFYFFFILINKNNENNEKINENTNSSLTAPMSLSPPTLSKVNPSSHITSFNLKPPLPSNLYKSQSSGLLSNANPSTSLRYIKSANSSPSSLQFDNNLNDPSNIFNPTSSFNTNPTSTNSTTTSTSTTSFLQKKQFNGTTATIHYLELKLNEKDKEMAVMKDNYEKTLKNLRSNLSKVKMESAIEIFELKNKVKGMYIYIIYIFFYINEYFFFFKLLIKKIHFLYCHHITLKKN